MHTAEGPDLQRIPPEPGFLLMGQGGCAGLEMLKALCKLGGNTCNAGLQLLKSPDQFVRDKPTKAADLLKGIFYFGVNGQDLGTN